MDQMKMKFGESVGVAIDFFFGLLHGSVVLEYDCGTEKPESADWINSCDNPKVPLFRLQQIIADPIRQEAESEASWLVKNYNVRDIHLFLAPEESNVPRLVLTVTVVKDVYHDPCCVNRWHVKEIRYDDYFRPNGDSPLSRYMSINLR